MTLDLRSQLDALDETPNSSTYDKALPDDSEGLARLRANGSVDRLKNAVLNERDMSVVDATARSTAEQHQADMDRWEKEVNYRQNLIDEQPALGSQPVELMQGNLAYAQQQMEISKTLRDQARGLQQDQLSDFSAGFSHGTLGLAKNLGFALKQYGETADSEAAAGIGAGLAELAGQSEQQDIPAGMSMHDIHGIGGFGKYAAQTAGGIAPYLAAGLVGGEVPMAAAFIAAGHGQMREALEGAGITDKASLAKGTFTYGTLLGALQLVVPWATMRGLSKPAAEAFTGTIADISARVAAGTLQMSVAQSLAMGLTKWAELYGITDTGGKPMDWAKLANELPEAMGQGLLAGAMFGGVGEAGKAVGGGYKLGKAGETPDGKPGDGNGSDGALPGSDGAGPAGAGTDPTLQTAPERAAPSGPAEVPQEVVLKTKSELEQYLAQKDHPVPLAQDEVQQVAADVVKGMTVPEAAAKFGHEEAATQLKDHLAETGADFKIPEDGVHDIAERMAKGASVDEAITDYAKDQYAAEAKKHEAGAEPTAAASGATATDAATESMVGGAASERGNQPAELGGQRTNAAGQAVPAESSQNPQLAGAEGGGQARIGQPTITPAHTAAFRDLLRGPTPRKQWAEKLGVDTGQLAELIAQSKADGLLRVDRNGVVRRTAGARTGEGVKSEAPAGDEIPTAGFTHEQNLFRAAWDNSVRSIDDLVNRGFDGEAPAAVRRASSFTGDARQAFDQLIGDYKDIIAAYETGNRKAAAAALGKATGDAAKLDSLSDTPAARLFTQFARSMARQHLGETSAAPANSTAAIRQAAALPARAELDVAMKKDFAATRRQLKSAGNENAIFALDWLERATQRLVAEIDAGGQHIAAVVPAVQRAAAALENLAPGSVSQLSTQHIKAAAAKLEAARAAAPLALPSRIEGQDVALTPKAVAKIAELQAAVDKAVEGILPRDVRTEVVQNIALARADREDEIHSVRMMRAATETPAFKNWFGDSKVVDEQGNPKIVYHGTVRGDFQEFDVYGAKYGLMGQGGYFTEAPAIASEYAGKNLLHARRAGTEAQTVYPVYLKIKNPIDMEAKPDIAAWTKAYDDHVYARDFDGVKTNEEAYRAVESALDAEDMPSADGAEIMQDGLRIMGYDGITHIGGGRVDPNGPRHRVWIAFNPEQIKSVFNRGTFDPNDPRISYSLRSTEDTLHSSESDTVAADTEGGSDEQLSRAGENTGSPRGAANQGGGSRPSDAARAVGAAAGADPVEARILRQESATLRADGSPRPGRLDNKARGAKAGSRDAETLQPIGTTEQFDAAGHTGLVTAANVRPHAELDKIGAPESEKRLATLTYRLYPEGTELTNAKRDVLKQLGKPEVWARVSQHLDGSWEVSNVEKNVGQKGLATKLYNAIEKDLGIRMSPSGLLTKDGLAYWQKRSPESVKWHQYSKHEGHYISPVRVKNRLDEIGKEIAAIHARPEKDPERATDLAGVIAERKELVKLWLGLPPEARVAAKANEMFALRAYHGSPHDFERFDMSKLGIGEGAQVFGHGLYFAENEVVAGQYAKDLGGHSLNGKPVDPNSLLGNVLERQSQGELPEFEAEIAKRLHEARTSKYQNQSEIKYFEDYQTAIAQAKQGVAGRPGKLYEVSLDVEHHQLLDWDKSLSEQSPEVQKAVSAVLPKKLSEPEIREIDGGFQIFIDGDPASAPYGRRVDAERRLNAGIRSTPIDESVGPLTGSRLYHELEKIHGDPDAATQVLREAGIPGIRYLDQGSRGAEPVVTYKGSASYPTEEINQAAGLMRTYGSADKAIASIDRVGWQGSAADHMRSLLKSGDLAMTEPKGTHNIVIFDDKLVKITHKNGEPVTSAERKAAIDEMLSARPKPQPTGGVEALGKTDPHAQLISIGARAVENEAARTGKTPETVAAQAARHEALEFFKDKGIIAPKEWETLLSTSRAEGWVDETGVREAYTRLNKERMSPAELESLIEKEAIMEKYGQYEKGEYTPTGVIAKVFKRIKEFLDRLKNAIKGEGFHTWEDIFQKVDTGELKRRYDAIYGDHAFESMAPTGEAIPASTDQLLAARAAPSPKPTIEDTFAELRAELGLSMPFAKKGETPTLRQQMIAIASAGDQVMALHGPKLVPFFDLHGETLSSFALPLSTNRAQEGFSRFFREFVLRPNDLRQRHADVYNDFADGLDAEAPHFLEALDRLQEQGRARLAGIQAQRAAQATAGGASGRQPPAPPPSGPTIGGYPLPKAFNNFANFYKRNFQPELVSAKAMEADPLFARLKAATAQEKDMIIARGEELWDHWNKVPEAERLGFLRDVDAGVPQKTPELAEIAWRYRQLLDQASRDEAVYGSKAGYVEDYLPRQYEDPEGVKKFIATKNASSGLGPKWFQKERHFDLLDEGMAAGYKLKTTNPEEIVANRLMAGADMRQRMELLQGLEKMGLARRVEDLKAQGAGGVEMGPNGLDPDAGFARAGWEAISAPNMEQWLIAPDIQALWANAVKAQGLWGNDGVAGSVFRKWMAFKNVWVPIKLSTSFFHPLHVIHINFSNNLARAYSQMRGGDFNGAFDSAVRSMDIRQGIGYDARMAWVKPREERTGPENALVDLMTDGGFSPQLSEQLRIAGRRSFQKAIDQKSWKIIPYALRRGIEKTQSWAFERWIPGLKAAAYIKEAQALFERNPDLLDDNIQRRVALRAIAKSVDNRFGEMFYSTLFWNRTVKDAGIASFLSLGWNLGFAREFGGAAIESGTRLFYQGPTPRQTARIATNKQAYALIYVTTAATIAGAMTYTFTGEFPVGWDYIFSRIGGKNPDGTPRRITNMFYTREIPMAMKHIQEQDSVAKGLGEMVWNKMMFQPFVELAENRDYWGYELWDENSPAYKKAFQLSKHLVLDQLLPITTSGATRAAEIGGSWSDKGVPLAFLGFGPAPAYAERTALENRIRKLYSTFVEPQKKPYAAEEADSAKRAAKDKLRMALQRGDAATAAEARVEARKAGANSRGLTQSRLAQPASTYLFSRLQPEIQRAVLQDASPEEVQLYRKFANAKIKKEFPAQVVPGPRRLAEPVQ